MLIVLQIVHKKQLYHCGRQLNQDDICAAGSTQEETAALVQQSINESKISGGDRPVSWDGETRSGAGLQSQLKQIHDSKVGGL